MTYPHIGFSPYRVAVLTDEPAQLRREITLVTILDRIFVEISGSRFVI